MRYFIIPKFKIAHTNTQMYIGKGITSHLIYLKSFNMGANEQRGLIIIKLYLITFNKNT